MKGIADNPVLDLRHACHRRVHITLPKVHRYRRFHGRTVLARQLPPVDRGMLLLKHHVANAPCLGSVRFAAGIFLVRIGQAGKVGGYRVDHPQIPGVRILECRHSAGHAALRAAPAQPCLHGPHAGQAAGSGRRPAEGAGDRGEKQPDREPRTVLTQYMAENPTLFLAPKESH